MEPKLVFFWLLLYEGFLEFLKVNLLLKVTFFNHNFQMKSRNKSDINIAVLLALKIPPTNQWEEGLWFSFASVAQECFVKDFLQVKLRDVKYKCEYRGRATGMSIF